MPVRRWPVRVLVLFVGSVVLISSGPAQMQERSKEGYIEKIFETRIGELPRMGWFGPGGFMAQEDAANEVNLFASLGMPSTARKKEIISGAELKRIRKTYGLACELDDKDHLAVFDIGRESETERALYISKKISGETRAGLVSVALNPTQMANVNRVLKWPVLNTLRRDESVGVRAQSFFYSFHRLYDPGTGALREEAIVLHRKDGEILAHELTGNLNSDQSCDGCGIPNYIDANSGLYRPLNMFELPGFAYPLLLLDTSTVEGRALSLLTFTPDGKITQFRVYEYVVHCG